MLLVAFAGDVLNHAHERVRIVADENVVSIGNLRADLAEFKNECAGAFLTDDGGDGALDLGGKRVVHDGELKSVVTASSFHLQEVTGGVDCKPFRFQHELSGLAQRGISRDPENSL